MDIERNQAYVMALAAAKSEFDELKPEYDKLQGRMTSLRTTMRGLSDLLGENLDDEYRFNMLRSDYNPPSKQPHHPHNQQHRRR
jgi:hypothetical protein